MIMRIKRPEIYLTNNKKLICFECKSELESKEKDFELKHIKQQDCMIVKEKILFCPICGRCYVNQDICRYLVRKYPGYYLDVSIYRLKDKKRKKQNNKIIIEDSKIVDSSKKSGTINVEDVKPEIEHIKTNNSVSNEMGNNTIKTSLYISNTYAFLHNVCPKCHSELSEEKVNVPVFYDNGDFFQYYVTTALFCHNCKKGYLSNDNVEAIIKKVYNSVLKSSEIRLENMNVRYDQSYQNHYYYPTINNEDAIYVTKDTTVQMIEPQYHSLNLNNVSFLGELGYTVNKGENARRFILKQAVQKYGKRKVADHISALIRLRKRQRDGAIRYAYAIRIWQQDLNYVSFLE